METHIYNSTSIHGNPHDYTHCGKLIDSTLYENNTLPFDFLFEWEAAVEVESVTCAECLDGLSNAYEERIRKAQDKLENLNTEAEELDEQICAYEDLQEGIIMRIEALEGIR